MPETLAQKISCEFCKMSTSFHRTPLVAASNFFFFSRNTSGGWFYSCFLQNAISELTCCFFHSVYIAVFFFESKDCYNDYQEVFKVRFIEKVFIHLIALKPLR